MVIQREVEIGPGEGMERESRKVQGKKEGRPILAFVDCDSMSIDLAFPSHFGN